MESTRVFKIMVSMLLSLPSDAAAAGRDGRWQVEGPVRANLIRVIDGDTLLVAANPWPQQTIDVYVRIRGIDAPETRSKCPATRLAGQRARLALTELLEGSGPLFLTQISGDKYFGRVVAAVGLSNGLDPAEQMLAAGYAHPYEGGTKTPEYCPAEKQ